MQLSETMPGQRVTVVAVVQGPAGARLEAVGFVAGTAVEVGRRAPLGDPTLYMVRGTQLALRRETAALVEVQRPVEVGVAIAGAAAIPVVEPARAEAVDAAGPLVGFRDD